MQGQFDGVTELWGFTDLLRMRRDVVLGGNIPASVNVALPGQNTVAGYPLAFDPTAKIVATGGIGASRLWSLADPARPRPLAALPGVALPVAISPDGRTLAAIGDPGDAQLWNIADPSAPRRLPGLDQPPDVSAMLFSPDGRTLATAAFDGTVRLWDMTNPARLVARLPFGDDASLAYTPDGRTLATGTIDGTVRLWDVTDPRHPGQVGTLTGTPGVNDTIVISPDGRTLAVAGAIQTTRLWDIHDPANPAMLAVLTGAGSPVAFTPDGHALAVIDPTGTVIAREINLRDAAAAVCALQYEAGSLALTLNADTWGQYFPDLPYQPPCP
jgi:WD40 repeat protein